MKIRMFQAFTARIGVRLIYIKSILALKASQVLLLAALTIDDGFFQLFTERNVFYWAEWLVSFRDCQFALVIRS